MGWYKATPDQIMISDKHFSNKKQDFYRFRLKLAERTGLEPATPGVTGRYSNQLNYRSESWWALRESNPRHSACKADALPTELSAQNSKQKISPDLAERTGLEPATPGVTGRYSNQLNYRSEFWWALRESNPRHSACKADALPTELSAQNFLFFLFSLNSFL